MNESQKSFLGWLLWCATVALILWVFCQIAMGSPKNPLIPGHSKHIRGITEVTQGLAAKDLIAPPPIIPAPKYLYPPIYFVATTVNSTGIESDYSNELIFTNQVKPFTKTITLAWDSVPSTTDLYTYMVYRGRAPGNYDTNFSTGHETSIEVGLYPPPPMNLVVSVTTSGATNIAASSSISGAWQMLNATNWTVTNPPSPRYFRAVGTKSSSPKLFLKSTRF